MCRLLTLVSFWLFACMSIYVVGCVSVNIIVFLMLRCVDEVPRASIGTYINLNKLRLLINKRYIYPIKKLNLSINSAR